MALFQVPGWVVPTAPMREQSQQVSKKRKRPSSDAYKLETAEVNIEKLMSKLTHIQSEESRKGKGPEATSKLPHGNPETKKRKKKQSQISPELQEDTLPSQKQNEDRSTRSKKSDQSNDASVTPKKKAKTKHVVDLPHSKSNFAPKRHVPSSHSSLTTLQKSMKEKLDGARFRLINENLYKSDSHTAHQMMRDDPQVFEEYHAGFRHQVLSWPTNPVQHYVTVFSSYPKKTVIADLGCGDAALAKSLIPNGISVISFDLVSDNQYVVEADICEKVPLPGSEGVEKEKSTGEGQVVDVVVCALSLMGVNWLNCLREAWRILKAGGELHIAEVTSRFTDLENFLNVLSSLGFRLKVKDESGSSHFMLFNFVKVPRTSKTESEWAKLLSKGSLLKPCEYKRR